MEVQWCYPVHHRVTTIRYGRDHAVLPASHTHLVCLDLSDGCERWRTSVRDRWGWLGLSTSSVAYLNQQGELVVLDRSDGDVRWARRLDGTNGWLHIGSGLVVVGGWRGYKDIRGFELDGGRERWRYLAGGDDLHRTALLPASSRFVICDAGREKLVSVDVESGKVTSEKRLPGAWSDDRMDRIPSANSGGGRGGQSLLLRRDAESLYRVSGNPLGVEVVDIGHPIATGYPEERRGVIGFMDDEQAFCTYNLEAGDLFVYETIPQTRGLRVYWTRGPRACFVGSAQGHLYRFSPDTTDRLKVAKAIRTRPYYRNGVVYVGTTSGEVVAVGTDVVDE